LIARDVAPDLEPAQPVAAVRAISQDADLKTSIELRDGRRLTGLDLQRVYLEAAQRHLHGVDVETDWLLREWAAVLDALASDPLSLRGRVDWITKRWMLDTFTADARVAGDDPWLVSLDLAYHHLDPERGLFRGLEAEGTVSRVASPESVERAMCEAPSDTRAAIRGLCVTRFANEVESVQWARIRATDGTTLDLSGLMAPDEVARVCELLREAPTLAAGMSAAGEYLTSRGYA
jgi:proteasome accessory factor A